METTNTKQLLAVVAHTKKKPHCIKVNIQLFATTVPTELVKQYWAEKTIKAAMNNIFFGKFTGTDANSIIQVDENLAKTKGDKAWFNLLLKLNGDPITGDNELEGHEQDLTYKAFGVTIDQKRWAVKSSGRMEEQKSTLKMREDAKAALETQVAEWLDKEIFKVLTDSPTSNRVIYAGGKTSENAITSTDVFNTDIIGMAKRKAQMADPIIRTVNVEGGNYYVMVIDPYQARDLKKDEKWFNAQKDANIRGLKNPIFSGALGIWDKVVVHEAETCPRTETGEGSAMVGHALLLGPQAGVIARAAKPHWDEDTFDYNNKWGVALSQILGVARCKYTLPTVGETDFATINIITSSADDGAAA